MLSQQDIKHVMQQLRTGLVPQRGLEAIAVGIEKQRGELHRQLEMVEAGEGSVKFLRGGYGCGKTFISRLSMLDAQSRGFATSFVVVSDNDFRFHRFEDIYSKVVSALATKSCPRGALGDILDRWIGRIEESLIELGADEEAPNFDDKVRVRLKEELASLTGGKAPPEFVRVVQTIFDLKQEGKVSEAAALLSWLSGSTNVAASVKKLAEIKGEISSQDAMAYLRGILEICKSAGYRGLMIVIDEAETILRMRTDTRGKSLNGIRQICDASGEFPGLLWVFTGTPEFFDSRRGVGGLTALHDRIKFMSQGGFASLRQAQLELKPFDADRLKNVAVRLRELFPVEDPDRVAQHVTDAFIDRLVSEVTKGFKGDVGVVPRQFLREFINVLDLVQENDDYVPAEVYEFDATDLSDEELAVASGRKRQDTEDGEPEFIAEESVW